MTQDAGGATVRGALRGRRLRQALAAIGTVIAVMAGSVGFAFANAANPLPDSNGTGIISGTVQRNADGSTSVLTGSVDVTVGGTWDWGTLSGSSTQSTCSNRYGVGAEVDWSGVSPSSSPGVAVFAIKGTNLFFHILDNTMDFVYPFTDPCQQVDQNGFPMGPWTARHTYVAPATIPAKLCVNMYDLHGSPGNLKTGDTDPARNGDNSVKTNDFNPVTNAGYCFAPKILNGSKIVTTATSASQGAAISDSATLSQTVNATGTITFTAYSNSTCTTLVFTKTVTLTSGVSTYNSGPFTPTAAGQYFWIAKYSGDNTNAPATGKCGDAGETSTVTPNPDLGITKTGPAQVELGQNIVYGITVKNTGLISYPNATFTDSVPSGTKFVSVTPAAGSGIVCNTTVVNNAVTAFSCNVGTLAPNATSAAVTVVVTPLAVGVVKNTATVPTDRTPSDDTSSVTTNVVAPPPDLAVVKTGPAQVELGQNITYGVTVKNTGIVSAPNATFTDAVPAGTKFVSVTPAAGSSTVCTTSVVNGAVTSFSCNVGTLAPNATSSAVTVVVTPLAVGVVKNTATVPTDRTPSDDTSSVTTNVVAPPSIAIAVDKTVDANGDGVYNDVETWKSGSTVTYKVVLHNTSTFTVHVDAMTDTINAATAAVCPNLVNTTLAAGAFSAPCTFTGSAPAAGSSIIDVVMATVSEVGNTTNKASALDTAKVITPAANPTPHFIELDPFAKVDADGDGTFHPVETATTPGGPVTFAVQFYSSADAPMVINKITDTVDSTTVEICTSLKNVVVQPNQFSTECTYPGTAPAGTGAESIHTIVVTASEVGVPTNTTSDSAPTTVATAPAANQQVLNMRLDKTVDANADGLYHGQETATTPSGAVMYQVQVTNLNSVAVTIDQLIDTTDGVTKVICTGFKGMQLAPNASSGPCFFSGTAGPAGHVVVDIVQANISAVNNTSSKGVATRTARVVSAPAAPAALSLAVVKTVDANADTVFNKAETATKAGATVTYHVAIKNNSAVPVKITGATDFINGTTTSVCGANVNAVLQPGASLASPCVFTSTAPAGGTSQADVVIVNAVDVNNAANATSSSDTASVTSPR